MLLSDVQLREAMERGEIVIDPPPEGNAIQPASVDLHIGREAFRAGDDAKIDLDDGDILRLPAGSMAIVLTKEELQLSPEIAGSIGLRSKFTRQGVDLLAGPQIDPGFRGPLHLTLINLSPSPVTMSDGDSFCTVEFHRLPEGASRSYDGEFQESYTISTADIQALERGDYTLSELYQSMSSISENVDKMEESINRMEQRYGELSTALDGKMRIFIGTIVALATTIIATLLVFLASVLGLV